MTTKRIDVVATDDELVCPDCGSDDLQMWADDGEEDLADYWECSSCKAYGCIVRKDDHATTQNGIAIDPARRLVV